MKKRILYVHNANFDIAEGNKFQVMNMCNAFFKANVKVTLFSIGSLKNINDTYNFKKKVKLSLIKPKENHYIRTLQLFLKFLKNKNEFDYIFTRDLLFAYLVSKFSRKKVIYESHQIIKKKSWKLLLNISKNSIFSFVVISNGVRDELMKLGIMNNKIFVLQDCVDLEKFDINLTRNEARKILNISQKENIISYVGNTDIERDLDTLIKVAKLLPEITFYVYGKKQNFLLEADNKIKNFHYAGFTKQPEVIYKASNILFAGFTNKIKTIKYMSPLKLFEYMGSKTPIIVADFERVREVVDENDVIFYESRNVNDLKKKINLINNEKNLQKKISKNSFNKVRKNYTWEKRTEKIIQKFNT